MHCTVFRSRTALGLKSVELKPLFFEIHSILFDLPVKIFQSTPVLSRKKLRVGILMP